MGSLVRALGNANSRFFTNCYLDPAALVPPDRRKPHPGGCPRLQSRPHQPAFWARRKHRQSLISLFQQTVTKRFAEGRRCPAGPRPFCPGPVRTPETAHLFGLPTQEGRYVKMVLVRRIM